VVFEALGDLWRVGVCSQPAISLPDHRRSLEWCALPDTQRAKVEAPKPTREESNGHPRKAKRCALPYSPMAKVERLETIRKVPEVPEMRTYKAPKPACPARFGPDSWAKFTPGASLASLFGQVQTEAEVV
jgi:hypothetical protein